MKINSSTLTKIFIILCSITLIFYYFFQDFGVPIVYIALMFALIALIVLNWGD